MEKYQDYQKELGQNLTEEELNQIDWTKYKIVVPNEKYRNVLMEAFKHIHYSDINTDYVVVNQLAHEYLDTNNIVVDEEIFNKLNNKN